MEAYRGLLEGLDVTRLLEIGVYHGQSLATWQELVPQALIVGVDNDPTSYTNVGTLVYADATDSVAMENMGREYGPFDVIIDDGSHEHQDVRAALLNLRPHLRKGGLYVVEDLDETDWWVRLFVQEFDGNVIPPPIGNPGALLWFT